jgi:hypothetical protein
MSEKPFCPRGPIPLVEEVMAGPDVASNPSGLAAYPTSAAEYLQSALALAVDAMMVLSRNADGGNSPSCQRGKSLRLMCAASGVADSERFVSKRR